jgi:hypothetical protein
MQLHSPYVRRGCCDGCEGMDFLAAKVGESGTEWIRIGGGQRREGEDGRAGRRREGEDGRAATEGRLVGADLGDFKHLDLLTY